MKDDCPWFKSRSYLHFDLPLSKKQACSFVIIPENIQSHSFYPFLHYVQSTSKLKDCNGVLLRHEKKRPISYAAHKDSHIFAYYTYLLNKEYESIISNEYNYLNDSILAFRKLGKSNIDFAKQAFDTIKELGNCAVLALDITGFFDNLDHNFLKKSWCKILKVNTLPPDHYAVYKAITKFSTVNTEEVLKYFNISKNKANLKSYKNKRICTAQEFREFRDHQLINPIKTNNNNFAIPQGSPISALLSNIYMLDFDVVVFDFLNKLNPQFKYFRYCDDILCIIDNKNMDKVENFIVSEIGKLKLQINEKKTEKVIFHRVNNKLESDTALQYLGFILKNDSISLRSTGFTRYSNKMKRGVSLAQQTHRKFTIIRRRRKQCVKKLYKKKLYLTYSHFGKRNFISYGKRAAITFGSKTIRKQMARLNHRLHKKILEYES